MFGVLGIILLIAASIANSHYISEARTHLKDKAIRAATIVCGTPEFPEEYLTDAKIQMDRADRIITTTTDALTVLDEGESERVKKLKIVSKELSKGHRQVDAYYNLAREWNQYRFTACLVQDYENDSDVDSFLKKSMLMPIKFVTRTSPAFPYYEDYKNGNEDSLVMSILELTPPEAQEEAKEFLTKYTIHYRLVQQFENHLKDLEDLASQNDIGKQLQDWFDNTFKVQKQD
jgi:hypothetical protein